MVPYLEAVVGMGWDVIGQEREGHIENFYFGISSLEV